MSVETLRPDQGIEPRQRLGFLGRLAAFTGNRQLVFVFCQTRLRAVLAAESVDEARSLIRNE